MATEKWPERRVITRFYEKCLKMNEMAINFDVVVGEGRGYTIEGWGGVMCDGCWGIKWWEVVGAVDLIDLM